MYYERDKRGLQLKSKHTSTYVNNSHLIEIYLLRRKTSLGTGKKRIIKGDNWRIIFFSYLVIHLYCMKSA